MTEFRVEVVRVRDVRRHPNADTLSIGSANGYPVIFRTGEYDDGSLAAYVPVDSVVPADDERWTFLGEHRRIRAKRLRGIFSMGLLTQPAPDWAEGADVAAALRVEKYEPPEPIVHGDDAPDPGGSPVYDIEGLRRYAELLTPGEPVWISEKIHGANARFLFRDGALHCGSRTRFKKAGMWNDLAARYGLAEKLAAHPGIVLYGEAYGQVQDLKYGCGQSDTRLICFDAYDAGAARWLNVAEFLAFCERLDLPVVPTLHRGPWSPDLIRLAEGPSTMPGANHVREGIVVKPEVERTHPEIGRLFLKMAGESYLTRKGA